MTTLPNRLLLSATLLASAVSGVAHAQPGYDPRYDNGYNGGPSVRQDESYPYDDTDRGDDRYYANGAPRAAPSDIPEPPGYDGTRPPPPPPGYERYSDDDQWRERDRSYAADAERWARDYCVKARSNAGQGALIGGVLGAIVGSALGGRHDHGGGAIAGLAVGAVGGAAIGSASSGDTTPGCPPGYVTRRDAPTYVYAYQDYDYAAPGWYRPWVYVDGYWTYRPYPYHRWYYRNYYYPRYYGGYGRGYYGGGWRGYRGGYYRPHRW